jgi:dephospho-CoA kinase
MVIKLGITGSIGSGKSFIGELLTTHFNIPVVDTDHLVHHLYQTDALLKEALVRILGPNILNEAGHLDRKRMGQLMFSNEALKKSAEACIHPRVRLEVDHFIQKNQDSSIVAVLVPLLFEGGTQALYDSVWVVVADEATLLKRVVARDGRSPEQIKRILSCQWSPEKKTSLADFVIVNHLETSEHELLMQLKEGLSILGVI